MGRMRRLQLDPLVQSVWISPTQLRFGIDQPLAILNNPPARVERLIEALRGGMPAGHLPHIAKAFGVSAQERDGLIDDLGAVLITESDEQVPGSRQLAVAVDAPDNIAATVAPILSRAGMLASDSNSVTVALVLSHFATPPARARRWANRGIPHLEAVFSERHVRIGPFAGLRNNACLHCAHLHRIDREPSWPAIASQCLGRTAATADPGFVTAVTGITLALMNDWQRDGVALDGEQVVVERDSQRRWSVRTEPLTAHERCDCHLLLS